MDPLNSDPARRLRRLPHVEFPLASNRLARAVLFLQTSIVLLAPFIAVPERFLVVASRWRFRRCRRA